MLRPRGSTTGGSRAVLCALVTSSGVALAVACSPFESSGATDAPPAEAGADSSTAVDAGDLRDAGPGRFCDRFSATALLCDDFEENDGGILGTWKTTADGGAIVAAPAPLRDGHAAKITATGAGADVALSFDFPVASAINGVVFEADMLVDTADYDYMMLCYLHTAGASNAYFGGISKSGNLLGKQFTPGSGPTVPIALGTWHKIHVELAKDPSFHQQVLLDGVVLDATTNDLSNDGYAQLLLGVTSPLPPGQPIAVVYFDDVVLRPR